MALTRLENGSYVIRNRKQAINALALMEELKSDIDELQKEHGIIEMMQDATELKKAATAYCVAKGIDRLDLPDGKWATLIEAAKTRRWILTEDEIEVGMPKGTKSLRRILKGITGKDKELFKKLWNQVTKRVPDPDGIQALVDHEVLTEEDVAPALVEETKTPYLRIFGESE